MHSEIESGSRTARWILIASCLVCILAMAPILDSEWHFDDINYISGNTAIQGDDLLLVFTRDFWGNPRDSKNPKIWSYRPVATFVSRLLWKSFQTPLALRAFNVVLHIFTALLLFRLIRNILRPVAAALASSYFMLHPTNGEVLYFAVGIAEVLALFFAALCFYFYWKRKPVAAMIFFGLALFSKESAVLLVLPIAIHAIHTRRWNSVNAVVRGIVPFITITLANYLLHFVITGLWKQPSDALTNPLLLADAIPGILHKMAFPGWYLWRLLWPMHYPADFSAGSFLVLPITSPRLWLGIATTAVPIVFALRFRRSDPLRPAMIGIGLYFALGMIAFQWLGAGSFVMADRLAYSPNVGVAIALGSLIEYSGSRSVFTAFQRKLVFVCCSVSLFGVLSYGLFSTIPSFAGPIQLAQAFLRNSPGGARAHYLLGKACSSKGDFPCALEAFSKACELYPYCERYCLGKAKSLSELGRQDEAQALFETLYRTYPGKEDVGYSYATYLWRTGNLRKAEIIYRKTADLFPESFSVRFEFARILHTNGKPEASLQAMKKACMLSTANEYRCNQELDLIRSMIEEKQHPSLPPE